MLLKTDKGNVYYEVHGSENLPVILFTHGATLNGQMYAEQVAALKSQFRVIVWDMAGHGQSYKLTGPFKVDEQARHVIGILDELGVEKAVLVGQSLGSWVIQYVASNYPDRVVALINIGGGPIHKKLSGALVFMYRLMNLSFRLFPEKMLYRWIARTKTVTKEAEIMMEQSMVEMGARQFYYVMDGMLDAATLDCAASPQPLLITHGEHEAPKYVVSMNANWHRETPGSKYAVIKNAGHQANQDNPEGFNQALLTFLKAL